MTTFEGPEKKLEIHFKHFHNSSPNFLNKKNSYWKELVQEVGAQIINSKETTEFKAFLLSESSLFVFIDRILLITCGQTQLIRAIPFLFKEFKPENVGMVFYERKNENFPQGQPSTFEEDLAILSSYFQGSTHIFGGKGKDHIKMFYSENQPPLPLPEDATLEILMHEPDRELMKFFATPGLTKQNIRRRLGLNSLFPHFVFDDFVFEPSGYSLNGLHQENYVTLHVTPQEGFSYVSFETNLKKETPGLIPGILGLFNPERAAVLLFQSHSLVDQKQDFEGFKMIPFQEKMLSQTYRVYFANLLKNSHNQEEKDTHV